MSRSFHVCTQALGSNWVTQCSVDTYEQAEEIARWLLVRASDSAAIEVTHKGLTIWGPYIQGGKFKP